MPERDQAQPVLLDVDTGVDDALAIMLACASPELELLAVTCVAGNASLPNVIMNTKTVLDLCGRDQVVVAGGADRPLFRTSITGDAAWVHGEGGRGYAEAFPNAASSTRLHAAQVIVDEARGRPGEVTLLTTGPLTNLAVALRLEPQLPDLLGRWVLMGSAYRVPGNVTPVAEFNVHADPHAAHIAFGAFATAASRPMALGLDVTHQVRLLPKHIERLAAVAGDRFQVTAGTRPWGEPRRPLLGYFEGAMRKYAEYHQRAHGFYGTFLHDPLTVATAADPSLVSVSAVAVQGAWRDHYVRADRRGLESSVGRGAECGCRGCHRLRSRTGDCGRAPRQDDGNRLS